MTCISGPANQYMSYSGVKPVAEDSEFVPMLVLDPWPHGHNTLPCCAVFVWGAVQCNAS